MKKKINNSVSHQYGAGSDISKGLGLASTAASAIPGVGTAISAGLGVLSGIAEGFNIDENKGLVSGIQNNINSLSSAGSYNDLNQLQQAAQTQINNSNFYNSGFLADLFGSVSKKEAQKRQQLNLQLANATGNAADNLNLEQGLAMRNNVIAEGGNLFTNGGDFTNGVNYIANGGTHEENPNGGVQMGIAPDGIKNTVEEGEVIYNDYVFSKRLKLDKEDAKNNFGLGGDLSFADAALKLAKESNERPNDPISKNGLDSNMYKLQILQEELKARREAAKQQALQQIEQFAFGGHKYDGDTGSLLESYKDYSSILPERPTFKNVSMPFSLDDPIKVNAFIKNESNRKLFNTDPLGAQTPSEQPQVDKKAGKGQKGKAYKISPLNYIPAIGSAIGAMSSLFEQPDYSSADAIQNYATTRPRAKYTPLGDYMAYQPKDYSQYLNNFEAQQAATRRGLTTEAARIAADYNANTQRGSLLSKINEARMADKLQNATFNRGTNQANAQLALQADNINAGIDRNALAGLAQAAQLRTAEDQALSTYRTSQLTNALDNWGNVGKQIDATKQLQWALENDVFGKLPAAYGGYIPKSKKSRRK